MTNLRDIPDTTMFKGTNCRKECVREFLISESRYITDIIIAIMGEVITLCVQYVYINGNTIHDSHQDEKYVILLEGQAR